jgi:hypothetical protein
VLVRARTADEKLARCILQCKSGAMGNEFENAKRWPVGRYFMYERFCRAYFCMRLQRQKHR